MENKQKPNYYAIIPAKVRYDKELSSSQKLFYGEITALAQKEGYCWAPSSYFENLYGVSKKTIYIWVKTLSDKGYIRTELVGEKRTEGRKIFITDPGKKTSIGRRKKTSTAPEKKTSTPPEKKTSPKYTSTNTTSLTLSTADAGGELNHPYEYTEPTQQTAVQKVNLEGDWVKLLKAYKPVNDSGLLNKKFVEAQKKTFGSFTQEERNKVIEWFSKYSHKMKEHSVWISTFFQERKTLHDVAEFFRQLNEMKNPQKEYKGDVKNNFDPNRNNY